MLLVIAGILSVQVGAAFAAGGVVDAVTDRYADVKPHTTAAAVVFALTRADADGWVE